MDNEESNRMDIHKDRPKEREIPPTQLDQIREKKHTCRECKKEFSHPFLRRICLQCYKRLKKNSHQNTKINKKKEYWLQKVGPIEIMIPTKEIWDTDYFQAITTKECAQCKQKHKKGETYYHTYKQYTHALGLPIHEIEELLEEYKTEFKNKRTITRNFLKERGLEIKEIKKGK